MQQMHFLDVTMDRFIMGYEYSWSMWRQSHLRSLETVPQVLTFDQSTCF